MPQFVILFHELPDESQWKSHWDLMLEFDGSLKSWALDESPLFEVDLPLAPEADSEPATYPRAQMIKRVILGNRVADHRIEYLTYEGPVSNNRGSVRSVDRGTYSNWETDSLGNHSFQLNGNHFESKVDIRELSTIPSDSRSLGCCEFTLTDYRRRSN